MRVVCVCAYAWVGCVVSVFVCVCVCVRARVFVCVRARARVYRLGHSLSHFVFKGINEHELAPVPTILLCYFRHNIHTSRKLRHWRRSR